MGKTKIVAEKKAVVMEKDPPGNLIFTYYPGDDEEKIKELITKYKPKNIRKKKK